MFRSKPTTCNSQNRKSASKESFYNKELSKNNIRLRNKVNDYINQKLRPETVDYFS